MVELQGSTGMNGNAETKQAWVLQKCGTGWRKLSVKCASQCPTSSSVTHKHKGIALPNFNRSSREDGRITHVPKGQAFILVPGLCLPSLEHPHHLTDFCYTTITC